MTGIHVFEIVVLILSVVVHEVAHGLMADRLGDPTAKVLGRLTLNPLKHLDPIGSILVPGILLLTRAGFVFGWAKPVPFDPRNLKNPVRDSALIAVCGPLSNLVLALFFGLLFRLVTQTSLFTGLPEVLPSLFGLIVAINISLAIFNLLPIPPLDGSKILYAFLPSGNERLIMWLESYGFMILILVLFTGILSFIYPIIQFLANLFLGVAFL